MAVVVGAPSDPSKFVSTGVVTFTWQGLGNGDTGNPLNAIDLPDKSVSVSGTFGAGGSVSIQNGDGNTLNDGQGNALTFTSAGVKYIAENFSDIHPNVTAGDGSTSIKVVIEATNPSKGG